VVRVAPELERRAGPRIRAPWPSTRSTTGSSELSARPSAPACASAPSTSERTEPGRRRCFMARHGPAARTSSSAAWRSAYRT